MAATAVTDDTQIPTRYSHTKYVQKRPLFSDDPVEYMRIETTDDGHLFILDKDVIVRFSELGVMVDAQDALNEASVESQPVVSLPIAGHSSPAMREAIGFMNWAKRWRKSVVEMPKPYVVPANDQLRHELMLLADFMGIGCQPE